MRKGQVKKLSSVKYYYKKEQIFTRAMNDQTQWSDIRIRVQYKHMARQVHSSLDISNSWVVQDQKGKPLENFRIAFCLPLESEFNP